MNPTISQHLHDSLVRIMVTGDKIFASRLLALRKQQGWSQPELAKKVGTSGAIIGRYERGKIIPSIGVARKLAEALAVTLDYLVGDNDLDIGHARTLAGSGGLSPRRSRSDFICV